MATHVNQNARSFGDRIEELIEDGDKALKGLPSQSSQQPGPDPKALKDAFLETSPTFREHPIYPLKETASTQGKLKIFLPLPYTTGGLRHMCRSSDVNIGEVRAGHRLQHSNSAHRVPGAFKLTPLLHRRGVFCSPSPQRRCSSPLRSTT